MFISGYRYYFKKKRGGGSICYCAEKRLQRVVLTPVGEPRVRGVGGCTFSCVVCVWVCEKILPEDENLGGGIHGVVCASLTLLSNVAYLLFLLSLRLYKRVRWKTPELCGKGRDVAGCLIV